MPQELRVIISGDSSGLERALGRSSAAAQGFAGRMQSIGKSMTSVGKTMTRDITLPIVAIGAASVKMASDFQSSMELIHTQANVSQKAVDQMSKSILKMAGSVGTGPETLSTGMFHLASQGLRGAKAMDALRIAAEGAKVGQANLEDVTNALGAVLVSGIKGSQNYSKAMGALNAVVGAGDMHMQDLADAMGTGLPAKAAVFGVSLRDAGAALAVFGDNNIRGADAGTLFNSTLRVMGAESKAAAKQLATIGIGSTQLANDMRSKGGLVSALEDLKSHMEKAGLSASQQAHLLTLAFGGRQAGGVLILLDQLQRLKLKEKEVADGAGGFGAAWQATTQTTAFKFDQMKAKLEAMGITLGVKLIPVVTQAGQVLVRLAGDFEQLPAPMQRIILYGAGIAAALGPAIGALGRLARAAVFITTNPIGAALAGAVIGAGIAAKVLSDVAQQENNAGKAAQNAIQWIDGLANSLHGLHDKTLTAKDAQLQLATSTQNVKDAQRTWNQMVADGKTKTEDGVRAYIALHQAENQRTRDAQAAKAANEAVAASERQRGDAANIGTQKTLAAADAFKKILDSKDPLRAMFTGYTAFFNNLGTAIDHPIAALEQFRLGSDRAANEGRLSAALGEISRHAFEMGAKLQNSDKQLSNTSFKLSLVAKAAQTYYDTYNKIPSKQNLITEVKLLGKEGYIKDLADYKAAVARGGEDAHRGFLAGVGKTIGDATSKVGGAIRAAANLAGRARTAGGGVGAALGAGIESGIGGTVGGIEAAAASAVFAGVAAAKRAARIKSPSGLTRDELGVPMMQGIAKGITDTVGLVTTALRMGTVSPLDDPAVKAEIAVASRVLGAGAVRGITDGIMGVQQSMKTQLIVAMKDAVHQAISAAAQQVATDRGTLASALSSLGGNVMSAAGALGANFGLSNAQGTGSRDLARKAAAEAAANAAQQTREQQAQLQRAIDAANKQLAADTASGASADQIAQDKQAIADAVQQMADFQAAQQQAADQKAADAAQKRDRDNLEKQWAALEKEIQAHPERAAKIRVQIDKLLAKYGITPSSVLAATDWQTAQTLFIASLGDVVTSMQTLTAAIDKLADLNTAAKTPAAPPSGGLPHHAAGGATKAGLAVLHDGEYVLNPSITRKIGIPALNRLNYYGHFNNGGPVGLPDPGKNPKINSNLGVPDNPAWRSAAMYLNDAGADKNELPVLSSLVGSLGPRAQAQAAIRHTTVPGFGELHQGYWRAPPPDPKMVARLQALFPGLVFETGTPGQQISAGQALSRITGGLGAVGGYIAASMGLSSKDSIIGRITSNAIHFDPNSAYLSNARQAISHWGHGSPTFADVLADYARSQNGGSSGASPGSKMGDWIPGFKTGGIMPWDGLAYLHKNERIIPAGGSRTVYLHATIELDGQKIGRSVQQFLLDEDRFGRPGLSG